MLQEIPVLVHNPWDSGSTRQNLMPGRYSVAVQLLSMAAFTLTFAGWLNETRLFWFENPVWLNRYTEYGIILGFGIWRIIAEQNPYTRKRFIILVFIVTVFWWLIPWLHPIYEPYVGFLWAQPVFPSLHVPGTLTFFLILGLAAAVIEQAEDEFTGTELATAREHFVRMQSLHLKNVYLGVGHQSPDYQWWHGQPALDGDLLRIKGTVGELYRLSVSNNGKDGGEW